MILEICFFKLCLSQGLNIFLLELSINISTKQIVTNYECDILVSCFLKYKKSKMRMCGILSKKRCALMRDHTRLIFHKKCKQSNGQEKKHACATI